MNTKGNSLEKKELENVLLNNLYFYRPYLFLENLLNLSAPLHAISENIFNIDSIETTL